VDRRAPTRLRKGNSGQDWRRLDRPSRNHARIVRQRLFEQSVWTHECSGRSARPKLGSQGQQRPGLAQARSAIVANHAWISAWLFEQSVWSMNAPVDRRAPSSIQQGSGNQDWAQARSPSSAPGVRWVDRGASIPRSFAAWGSIPRKIAGMTGGECSARPMDAPQNRPQNSGSNGSLSVSELAPAQRDSGNWRQSAPRDNGRQSRPQLDMRQPIVTPRNSPLLPATSWQLTAVAVQWWLWRRASSSEWRRLRWWTSSSSGGSYGNYGGGRAPAVAVMVAGASAVDMPERWRRLRRWTFRSPVAAVDIPRRATAAEAAERWTSRTIRAERSPLGRPPKPPVFFDPIESDCHGRPLRFSRC